MKRIAVVTALVATLGLSAPNAHAAPRHTVTAPHTFAQTVAGLTLPRPSSGATLQRLQPFSGARFQHLRPESVPHQAVSGQIQSANALRIPTSTVLFYGLGMSVTANSSITTDQADHQTIQGLFFTCMPYPTATSPCTGITYHNLGALGAYYEEGGVQYSDGEFSYLSYLGTYYTSADAATTAFSTILNNAINPNSSSPSVQQTQCQVPVKLSVPTACAEFSFTVGTGYRMDMRVIQISNAIFEGGYILTNADYQANQSIAEQQLDGMSNAFLALFTSSSTPTPVPTPRPTLPPTTPTPQPTLPPAPTPRPTASPTPVPTQVPVQFSVKARWEKAKAKPALNGKALKSSKVGKAVQADLYVMVGSAPNSAPVSIHVEVRLGGKAIAKADDNENLASSDVAGWYPDPFNYKPTKAGSYKIYTRVQIGDKVETATSGPLKVTK